MTLDRFARTQTKRTSNSRFTFDLYTICVIWFSVHLLCAWLRSTKKHIHNIIYTQTTYKIIILAGLDGLLLEDHSLFLYTLSLSEGTDAECAAAAARHSSSMNQSTFLVCLRSDGRKLSGNRNSVVGLIYKCTYVSFGAIFLGRANVRHLHLIIRNFFGGSDIRV